MLTVRDLTLSYGGDPLLAAVRCRIAAGERIALVGRNGSGKSTLLKLLAGEIEPDGGEIVTGATTRIARLPQEVPQSIAGDLFDVVASGLSQLSELLSEYHRLSQTLEEPRSLARLQEVQAAIDAVGGWDQERRVERVMSRLDLPQTGRFETLSGGLKRRVLLARALVAQPDLLLLDEPTNHLDVAAIEWLEQLLLTLPGTLVFVTHDRAFLRRLATRIFELDRGRLTDWPGDYPRYLERKHHQLTVQKAQEARFDKKLAQEESWVRQGIKARRTRNEGRVRALERLREQRRQRREVTGKAKMRVEAGERSGKIVIETEELCFSYPNQTTGEAPQPSQPTPVYLVEGFSTTIQRGDKIGILGPNGSGKTTLLKLLLGELSPTAGKIQRGRRLEVAYFDQHREQLDEELSVADNVAEGNDTVTVQGQQRHVISYLQDFLFPPEQTRSPVATLSGGERNRLLLARLFTRSFNFLVMDEPTNDLDIETLELLESLLVEFEGTLLLVSHDRAFLDNVVTSTLVMEGEGRVGEYAGGYSDWLEQRPSPPPPPSETSTTAKTAKKGNRGAKTAEVAKKRKLGYREKLDLEALPGRIEELEEERAALHTSFADPDFFQREGADAAVRAHRRLAKLESELEAAYTRWEELDSRSS